MAENPTDISSLLPRYANRETLSDAEETVLATWLHEAGAKEFAFAAKNVVSPDTINTLIKSIEAKLDEADIPAPVRRMNFSRVFKRVTAAAILLLIAGAAYFYMGNGNKPIKPILVYEGDVAPGKTGARIRLSDGRIISLENIKDGLVANDGPVKVYKENGQIIYKGTVSGNEALYNEVFADNGRVSEPIVLPDGSTVWLNAGSSLRYPLHFPKNERDVELKGEGSFKVVHNEEQPFRVTAKGQVTEDIGTEFNINAYDNEPVVTTSLIEGSVSITSSSNHKKSIVRAGEQAVLKNNTIIVAKADVESSIAWRKGYFSFEENADIKAVMRQLGRWYNVEVRYEGDVRYAGFGGKIDRSQSLAEVLKGLESMKIHFRIEEDKRIIVMP
jgi:transmembrane sensor